MKTRYKAAASPTVRLILRHLSDPTTHTPASIDSIAIAIGSPASSTRKYLQSLTRDGILIRSLKNRIAHFALVPTDLITTKTPVNIPGTNQAILRLTHSLAPTASIAPPPA